jgi:hypothetical protein
MSFLPAQQLSICKILGINKVKLTAQLTYFAPDITSEIEAAVQDEIDRWDSGIGAKFTRVEPNSANFGARIDPDLAKEDVRQNIANLLFFDMSDLGRSSIETFEIERG